MEFLESIPDCLACPIQAMSDTKDRAKCRGVVNRALTTYEASDKNHAFTEAMGGVSLSDIAYEVAFLCFSNQLDIVPCSDR